MRVVIWMNMPSHHQSAYFEALRHAGVDLTVRYYEKVTLARKELGWEVNPELPAGEEYLVDGISPLEQVPNWQEAVHVVPGCRTRFLRSLATRLAATGTNWVHWSEHSHPGLRFVFSYLPKRVYGELVNRTALGAFGVSTRALREFRLWGIRAEKTALLPYSIGPADESAEPDDLCEQFRQRRPAFLFLGALQRRKAVDVLLRSFSEVCPENRDWVLLLVGNDKSHGAYQRMAKRLALDDRVLFRGPVAATQISGALQCAKVLILPSRNDGWGAVAAEAASAKRALILSDRVGAAYHLLAPGENGFRVRAGSVASLAEAMHAYMQDETLAARHGEKSLEQFEEFTPAKNAERFIATLDRWIFQREHSQHCGKAA